MLRQCKLIFAVVLSLVGVMAVTHFSSAESNKKVPPVLDFKMKSIDGKKVRLSDYTGNVIILVNVASLCGNTPQYASLEKLYQENRDKGFVILAFPSNDFHQQEPGTDKEIKAFCTSRYHVTFPMFSKIDVKGKDQHPLYRFLTSKTSDPRFGGEIEWNFAKFLIGRDGEIVGRFPARMDPLKPDVVDAIKRELDKPK